MARRFTPDEIPGICFIVAGPSGAGKATLLRRLLDEVEGLVLVHSHTTRPARRDDDLLRKYRHVSDAEFREEVANGGFLEWAQVHGYFYGTPVSELLAAGRGGKDVILELDVQGVRQAKPLLPDPVTIFIMAPNMEALRERMEKRDVDTPSEEIETRLKTAEEEMRHRSEFDYVILNDDVEVALKQLRAVIVTERARPARVLRRAEVSGGG